MYQQFFLLNQQPFSATPSPDLLFFTEQHKEALAHLSYGLQGNGGFVVLTGEVGSGKTTICQYLLQNMPDHTDIASITTPAASEISLLVDICEQFSINYDRENISLKEMFDALTSWMLENQRSGRHAIVLIDEAQHLSFTILEQLRLLTNIETNNQKPLQIILVGQTQLQEKLLTNELRQLSQRITARYHLLPLNKQDTHFYIYHRLNLSGAKGPIFSPQSIATIFKASGGVPRLINRICDRCLLTAYTQASHSVTNSIVKQAVKETDLPKKQLPFKNYIPHATTIVAMIALAFYLNTKVNEVDELLQEDAQQVVIQDEWSDVINQAHQQAKHKQQTLAETLLAIPESYYSLQLVKLPTMDSVQDFFEDHPQLFADTYLYYENRSEYSNYVVLLGKFDSYQAARESSKKLTQDYPELDPWIIDYKTIQSDIQ